MKRLLILLLLAGLSTPASWGKILHTIGFNAQDRQNVPSSPFARHTLYTEGVWDEALDLTETAPYRTPITLDPGSLSLAGRDIYSISVWVRVPKGSEQNRPGAAIVTNVDTTAHAGGFTIGASANGSWYAGFTDDTGHSLWYEPTVARQPIADDRWHLLVLLYDGTRRKARFYYDGKNVAIYNLSELGCINHRGPIRIGGAEPTEQTAFNGLLDEFAAYDTSLSPEAVFRLYASYYPLARGEQLPDHRNSLRLMEFNIQQGGTRTGTEAGPKRVADVIRDSGAEVVGLVETDGSGPKIADALSYCLYLHSSNLSILSRFPIVETADIFQPSNCSAVRIQLSKTQQINYINLQLSDPSELQQQLLQDQTDVDSLLLSPVDSTDCPIIDSTFCLVDSLPRRNELQQILYEADSAGLIYDEKIPTFLSGDFRTGSHRDRTEPDEEVEEVESEQPSRTVELSGFTDSYRKLHPDPKRDPGKTRLSGMESVEKEGSDRTDFIYYKGIGVVPRESRPIDSHRVRFPSDHAALLSVFDL